MIYITISLFLVVIITLVVYKTKKNYKKVISTKYFKEVRI